jgi:hypothetical protein
MTWSTEEQLVNLEFLLYTFSFLKNLTQQREVKEIYASVDQVSILLQCAGAGLYLQWSNI